jgi:hypothetical protein
LMRILYLSVFSHLGGLLLFLFFHSQATRASLLLSGLLSPSNETVRSSRQKTGPRPLPLSSLVFTEVLVNLGGPSLSHSAPPPAGLHSPITYTLDS